MSDYEVPEPILCSPFDAPGSHWLLREGHEPTRAIGRRAAQYFYRDPSRAADERDDAGIAILLPLVNRLRGRVQEWRQAGYPGTTRTTLELLTYWQRDGRQHRLFFAQREAAETIIFLIEGRRDLRQGIEVPSDEPSDAQKADLGYRAFRRYSCKMATGSGKTTVMGLLAA